MVELLALNKKYRNRSFLANYSGATYFCMLQKDDKRIPAYLMINEDLSQGEYLVSVASKTERKVYTFRANFDKIGHQTTETNAFIVELIKEKANLKRKENVKKELNTKDENKSTEGYHDKTFVNFSPNIFGSPIGSLSNAEEPSIKPFTAEALHEALKKLKIAFPTEKMPPMGLHNPKLWNNLGSLGNWSPPNV